jgi:LPS-assembly protein
MRFPRVALILSLLLWAATPGRAAEDTYLVVEPRNDQSGFYASVTDRSVVFTNGLIIKFSHPTYGQGVMLADKAQVNQFTGDVAAEGNVRLQRDDLVWVGDKLNYNVFTRKMGAQEFRAGGAVTAQAPVFAAGRDLGGDYSNNVYTAGSAMLTTDDIENPPTYVRASSITIAPGKYLRAKHAVVYAEGIPVFYFPVYTLRLDGPVNRFDFVPGYRSRYGAYLLSSYHWTASEQVEGVVHGDYRTERGGAAGLDLDLHLGRWGETSMKSYYLDDKSPQTDNDGYQIPEDRGRFALTYDAAPFTNFTVKSQIRYQSDERILYNFFESEYRANPQPSTFLELNGHTDNFALDVYGQPRINDFFENVERVPEIRLTGFSQQVPGTPVYYDSESSAGYYRRSYAVTNDVVSGPDYEAARADTFHQLTLPLNYFGWLNLIPRVGGRLTYYGEADGPGATTTDLTRTVFNTGAEVNFKLSQTWAGDRGGLFALDGLRHILEPSANYVYVPEPSDVPNQLPQFDTERASLRLLPNSFPEYNAIDSVDSQSTVRLGVRNRFQTKREGVVQDFVYWDLYSDWRLDPQAGQNTFSDIFSDLLFRPRTWLILESLNRFDIYDNGFRLSYHNLTFAPNNIWSWGLGLCMCGTTLIPPRPRRTIPAT